MSSILTNNSAMAALQTLQSVNKQLGSTQDRISTGLKVQSGKDNASYFSISTTMNSESGMNKAVNEGLTLAKNSVSTARLGAETMNDLAQKFVERVAFAQNDGVSKEDVQKELDSLVAQMTTTIAQSSFNGENLINTGGASGVTVNSASTLASITTTTSVVSGITRTGSGVGTTTIQTANLNLEAVKDAFDGIDISATGAVMADQLSNAKAFMGLVTQAATELGIAEKAIETQQDFLGNLTDRLDSGVGSMVDANMEEEAARLQSLQVQQQLSTQSLSIANQGPQNILSLFR